MAETFLLEIVTPSRKLLSTEVNEMTAPGFHGEFGVLPGHTEFLTILRPGEIKFKKGSQSDSFAVGKGYAEVLPDKTTVIVDIAESWAEIDLAKAKKELTDLEESLCALNPEDPEYEPTCEALEVAKARVTVKEKHK
jgi:F-type H+-transporting ATPase subunit epsilon